MAAFSTIALLALAGASTAISAASSIKAGNAAKRANVDAGAAQQRAADSQAELDDFNAHVADLQEADALDRGRQEESAFRQQVRTTIGGQRADLAANGVDVAFGSAVDVQADAAYLGELDALRIRTNAAREAWGYNVAATDARNRAAVTRKEGANAAEAGVIAGNAAASASRWQAVGTIAGGATSLYEARYGFGRR